SSRTGNSRVFCFCCFCSISFGWAALIMHFFSKVVSSVSLHWWVALAVPAIGIVAICVRALESEKSRRKRAGRKKERELRVLTEKISTYARDVHQQFPTGDVVVSERDLAEQLRKRPEIVVTALNLLLNQQRVQRAPLSGYWKLNS